MDAGSDRCFHVLVLRVCYYLETHRDPRQVARLVGRLRSSSPDAVVLVQHDSSGEPLDVASIRHAGADRVLLSPGGYGTYAHVDRYLGALAELLADGVDFDWACNLSGQDYPVTPLAQIERELTQTGAAALLETFRLDSPGSHWSPRRVHTRYDFRYARPGRPSDRIYDLLRPLAVVNRLQPWVRFSPAYGAVGVRRRYPFADDLPLHGGSFFGCLSVAAVEHLLAFSRDRPDFVAWAKASLAPEEVVVQTVLQARGDLVVQAGNRRFYDFTTSRGNHPRLLDLGDLDRLLSSDAWFARKVAAGSPLLDALDAHLSAV
jgi:hypothetical protein